MSDFMVSRVLVLNQNVQPCPPGPAIRALQEANTRLEQARPVLVPVPAYDPNVRTAKESTKRHGR
jgi:hypothetical protein